MTMTMTTDSIAVILACPAPRLDWRSKIPWPQREPVALSKWTEVRNAKTTSAKKCPTSKNQPPKLHLLLIFKFSDVFRICPIFINLQLSQTSKFFPQLHLPTAGITSTGSFSTSEEKLCTATGHVAEKSNVCRDGDAASVESWFG